jgi:hypothetical protein
MDIKKLETRAQELAQAIDQSVANHHNLLGRHSELVAVMAAIKESETLKEKSKDDEEIVVKNCS